MAPVSDPAIISKSSGIAIFLLSLALIVFLSIDSLFAIVYDLNSIYSRNLDYI